MHLENLCKYVCFWWLILLPSCNFATVKIGLDNLFQAQNKSLLEGQNIGLITNHTAYSSEDIHIIKLFEAKQAEYNFKLTAIFAPEHGLFGSQLAAEKVANDQFKHIPVYSLHGDTRRPTDEMLKNVTTLVFDIQDIGSRSYTFISTLFYAMEEAAKRNIKLIVLDRPNPMNGVTVDGPLLEPQLKSFVGYINVPYCHGMTVGELAGLFNFENQLNLDLTVVKMTGWQRKMKFSDTDLKWIPPSPNIAEAETVFFYPSTGILGEISLVNIGIGYTLPFKLIGAPWMDAEIFTAELNSHELPGVKFFPYHYKPFYGLYAGKECHGSLIVVENFTTYKPVTSQYIIITALKKLYESRLIKALKNKKRPKVLLTWAPHPKALPQAVPNSFVKTMKHSVFNGK